MEREAPKLVAAPTFSYACTYADARGWRRGRDWLYVDDPFVVLRGRNKESELWVLYDPALSPGHTLFYWETIGGSIEYPLEEPWEAVAARVEKRLRA